MASIGTSFASVLPADGPLWALLLGGLGAIFGSFIAALVIRWPQERSVIAGRSACDACGQLLGPRDLVPLVSALMSRGKCRHCAAPIAPIHWQIEFAALAIGAVAGALLPGAMAIAAAAFGWLLLALAALDLTELWLPDELTLTLALLGLLSGAAGIVPELAERLIGGAVGFAGLFTVALAYRLLRGREGLGGGDPKLFGAIGLWLGWRLLPVVLLLAALTGLGVVVFRLATGRPVSGSDALPFGALLAIAAYPAEIVMLRLAA